MKKIDVDVEKVLEYKEIIMQHNMVQESLSIQKKIAILNEEVNIFKSRLQEHDTGHIHTAIGVMQHRIAELEEQFIKEQGQRNR